MYQPDNDEELESPKLFKHFQIKVLKTSDMRRRFSKPPCLPFDPLVEPHKRQEALDRRIEELSQKVDLNLPLFE